MEREIDHINARPEAVEAFCKRWHIGEFSLFGSVLRDDFGPESDIDVLVRFQIDHTPGLMGIIRLEREMADLFGRRVDLVTRNAIERSRNHIRRKAILTSARVFYAA